ncbi:MAG: CHAT domain-containing protein [Chitinophagaceae bacterium]|nr:CHAT domain-containing protein [Chitinophagaceae bacterium]
MSRITIACIIASLLAWGHVCAQCPDRLIIADRITALKHSDVSPADQLKELNGNLVSFQKCPLQTDTVFAYLLQRIGALYFIQKDFKNAVNWSLQSIKAEASNPDFNSRTDFNIRVYHYLQMFYDSLHMQRQKMEAADSCINIAMRTNRITDDVLFNISQKVDYSFDVGDYQRCTDYAKIGESITGYSKIKDDSIAYVSGFFNMHVNGLTLMKKFDEAERILYKKIREYEQRNKENHCGVFYNQLAEISTQRHEYDSSILFLNRSLKCNKSIGNQLYCKQSYNNIGFLYQTHLDKPDIALPFFLKALKCRNDKMQDRVADAIETLNIYDNIANVFAARREFDSAYYFYGKAFGQLKKGITEENVLNFSADEFIANKKMQYLTGLIKDKADAYLLEYISTGDTGYIKKSIRTYKIADQVLTRARSEQAETSSGIVWRANARNLYEKAIQACKLSNDENNAFYFFEKSRAALLNDQVAEQRHSSEEEIRRQVQLKKKLEELKNKLDATVPASVRYSDIQKDIYNTIQENDVVSLAIKRRDPLYYRNYIDTSSGSIYSIRAILQNTGSLMEIFYGDSAVYILFVSGKENKLKEIDKNKYDELTATFNRYISDPDLLNAHYDVFLHAARELYVLLFDQIPLTGSRLIISPDGRYFPFESLVSGGNLRSPQFMLYDYAVSYTYSAGYLANDIASNGSAKPFMGMAPVQFASSMRLPVLPGSDASLQKIAYYFKEEKEFIHATATKNNFLDNFFNFRILQLYTHASEGSANEDPRIYFADSSLKLSDIDPVFGGATRLIVLSACETGNGAYLKGEGVFSFNRIFASIGIPSSMVNLWSVDNQAVYSLTELFYKYMVKGLPIDVSLQKAKIEFIKNASKERTMPYYWAAAVIVGRSDAVLPAPASFSGEWLVVIISILLTGCLLYSYFKKK